MSNFSEYTVKRLPIAEVGRWRARLAESARQGQKRHKLLKLTTMGGKKTYVIGLGHELGQDIVQIDYDVRQELGELLVGERVSLKVEPANWFEANRWYLCHRDPYVWIPARLSAISLFVGIIGLLLAVYSIWPSSVAPDQPIPAVEFKQPKETPPDTQELPPPQPAQMRPGPWQEPPSRLFGPCSYAWPASYCPPRPVR
ncbi:hypothetical protein SAMN04488103_104118 [Gemmobacter aquatilis]|uniref:Uncharacterized protein n=1 Tax=Gemmobacter aquatilis TaxID=933059 RepID=A0A1H8FCC1_9RHOB|nr:hypothetical protein SAMN04488103_104118 [Gemmobacter aquatilis]